MSEHENILTEKQQATAAAWMARCDRGLSQSEKETYREWLADDPAHAQEIQHLEKVWRFCDRLGEWHPIPGKQPNPDLLAPRQRRSWLLVVAAPLTGIAAVLALLLYLSISGPVTDSVPVTGDRVLSLNLNQSIVITGATGNQRLEDGSEIIVQSDTILELIYSESERRVNLIRGEASFTVVHDPVRPFVVEVAGISVHAIGTVFRVALDEFDVSVEVTEGSVRVRNDQEEVSPDTSNGIILAAGEKKVLRFARLIPFDEMSGT